VIAATRTEVSPFSLPTSIDVIGGDAVHDRRLRVNISERLGWVPGLPRRDRQNDAQDVQISVRGFGTRSTFGIPGARVYVGAIAATLPHGQGQISIVDLGSAERIDVLRGPFSAQHGSSVGGVIQVLTKEGSGQPKLTISVAGGSDGTLGVGVKASGSGGAVGAVGCLLDGSDFSDEGYRAHGATEGRIGNMKLSPKPDDLSKLNPRANSVSRSKAQDELALSRVHLNSNPRGVGRSTLTFNTCDGNSRFFEPAPRRTWTVGLSGTASF
jgi:iron complex outermembrane receptor protein